MRHSFKKGNNNFIIKLTEKINNKVDEPYRQKWYDVIDNIVSESKLNLDKVENIISNILQDYMQESVENIIEEINNRYCNEEDAFIDGDEVDVDHLKGIVNEWEQIEEQSQKAIGKSISIANNVAILKGDEESSYEISNIDNVEIIDLGLDMDEDPNIFNDHVDKANYRCVFCNSKNILVISSTEAFCNNCDKNFLVANKSNVLPLK